MIGAWLIATTILLQAQPAVAPQAVAPSASPAAPAGKTVSPLVVTPQAKPNRRQAANPDEVICQNEVPVGSRFPVKVCAKRSEFAERTRQQQELIRDWQRTPIT